jgi:hypothetical protein
MTDWFKMLLNKSNRIYEEIELNGSIKKNTLLKNMRQFYLLEKGNFVDFNNVKENADNIIDNIKDKLWEHIEKSKNYDIMLPIEVVEMSLLIIIVDAFMRCEILEEPK